MSKRIIPDGFIKRVKEVLGKIEEKEMGIKEKQKAKKEAEQSDARLISEAKERYASEQYPKTLQQSVEILEWVHNFFSDLDPEELSILEKSSPVALNFFSYGCYCFNAFWNIPEKMLWRRGRRFMYDTIVSGMISGPEDLAGFGPEIVSNFYIHLHSGVIWKNLEVEVHKKFEDLVKKDESKN